MNRRTQTGSFAALGFIAMVPLMVAIGAFAVDLMHLNATKGELQRSCDAAALAGASRLFTYHDDSPKGQKAKTAAEAILAANFCDGRFADPAHPDVEAFVSFPTEPDANGLGGSCRVDARMQTTGFFSKIFGNYRQTVTASATAGSTGTINSIFAGHTFPIVLGLNINDPVRGVPLSSMKKGELLTIRFSPDGSDNAGWTTLNKGGGANEIRNLIEHYRDPQQSGASPVKVNDSIDLKNGEMTSAQKAVEDFRVGDTVIVPVVNVTKFNGSGTVVGFVGLTIKSVTNSGNPKSIVAELNNAEGNGVFDPALPPFDNGAPNAGTFFQDKKIAAPKLIL